jgi:hypothetical protein
MIRSSLLLFFLALSLAAMAPARADQKAFDAIEPLLAEAADAAEAIEV